MIAFLLNRWQVTWQPCCWATRQISKGYEHSSTQYCRLRQDSTLTYLPLDKIAAISQTTFSNAFSWMKSFVFWFLKVQITIFQHWFRYWLGANQATSHYLNQCWHSSLMHIWGTSRTLVNFLGHLSDQTNGREDPFVHHPGLLVQTPLTMSVILNFH